MIPTMKDWLDFLGLVILIAFFGFVFLWVL